MWGSLYRCNVGIIHHPPPPRKRKIIVTIISDLVCFSLLIIPHIRLFKGVTIRSCCGFLKCNRYEFKVVDFYLLFVKGLIIIIGAMAGVDSWTCATSSFFLMGPRSSPTRGEEKNLTLYLYCSQNKERKQNSISNIDSSMLLSPTILSIIFRQIYLCHSGSIIPYCQF